MAIVPDLLNLWGRPIVVCVALDSLESCELSGFRALESCVL